MPPTLLRQLRALVEQTNALTSSDHRASHKKPEPSQPNSRPSIRWRGDFSTKTLDKLIQIFKEEDHDGFASTIGRRSTKPVSLETAAKALLQLWGCCMTILDVLADGAAPEPSLRHTMAHSRDVAIAVATEKKLQLKQVALTLLTLVIRRQEFDALLVAVGHGGCESHKPLEDSRHGRSRLSRRLSRQSRRSTARQSNGPASAILSSQLKKSKHKSAVRICDSVHHYLELHESTFQYAYETLHGPIESSNSHTEFNQYDQHQELLAALVATSYLRVPRLRSHILDSLSTIVPLNQLSHTRPTSLSIVNSRGRCRSAYDDKLRLTPFHWHLSMYPQCQSLLTTVNREERWTSCAQMLHQLMDNTDGCMFVLAQIYEQLTGQQVLGNTNWKCIPGADILQDATLAITKTLYQTQLQQCELRWQDSADDKADNTASSSQKVSVPSRDSLTLFDNDVEESNTPTACFTAQVIAMTHENDGFLHEYLMTILRLTNYMQSHHVTLCLQYLERLIDEFPAYFGNELAAPGVVAFTETSNMLTDSQQEEACRDVETLRFVFSCLLDSEHYEILKTTEMFLLRNFMKFSIPLQVKIVELLGTHVKRLFLHWNRDVRYCYYHILLYLTYPGNRMVLCAKSDEALMGADASWLFEIPGLIRTGTTESWEAFDVPLHEIVTLYTQRIKRRPQTPSWVSAVPSSVVQRSVTEYKTHMKTYFAFAQQLSMHQRVPTPEFSIKAVVETPVLPSTTLA